MLFPRLSGVENDGNGYVGPVLEECDESMKQKVSTGTLLVLILVALAALMGWWALKARRVNPTAPSGQSAVDEVSAESACAFELPGSFEV